MTGTAGSAAAKLTVHSTSQARDMSPAPLGAPICEFPAAHNRLPRELLSPRHSRIPPVCLPTQNHVQDDDSYFTHKRGFLAYESTVSEELLAAARDVKHSYEVASTVPHFALVNRQLAHTRNAMIAAEVLGQPAVVLPKFWVGLDRWWAPHNGRLPGSKVKLPFLAPTDLVLDLEVCVGGWRWLAWRGGREGGTFTRRLAFSTGWPGQGPWSTTPRPRAREKALAPHKLRRVRCNSPCVLPQQSTCNSVSILPHSPLTTANCRMDHVLPDGYREASFLGKPQAAQLNASAVTVQICDAQVGLHEATGLAVWE